MALILQNRSYWTYGEFQGFPKGNFILRSFALSTDLETTTCRKGHESPEKTVPSSTSGLEEG